MDSAGIISAKKNPGNKAWCKLDEWPKVSYLQRKCRGFTASAESSVTALLVAPTLSLRTHWAASTVSQSQEESRLTIKSLYTNESVPQIGHEKLKVLDVFFLVWVEVEYRVGSTTQTQHQKDKERVVVCLCGTGQELHWKGYYTKGIDAAREQRFLWLAEAKKDDWNRAWTPLEPRAKTCTWLTWINLKIWSL